MLRAERWGEPEHALEGAVVSEISVHGKWLFIGFGERVLVTHLGMDGSWHRYRPGERWREPRHRAGILLATATDEVVCFEPKEARCLERGSFALRDLVHRLGPDLATEGVDIDAVVQAAGRFAHPELSISDLLLDQRPASGIGNVYRNEVLFLEGVHPLHPAQLVQIDKVQRCYELGHELLLANLPGGLRTTRDTSDGNGPLWVYERSGQPCLRCGDRIRYARLGKNHRSTFWCATCQPEHPSTPRPPRGRSGTGVRRR